MLVLALDGASFDVIQPLVRAGRLPHLGQWIHEDSGSPHNARSSRSWAPLESTCPPVTFPAWSSFMTGLEPGRHGVFDFTQKIEGTYRVRFVNATDRAGASLFARVSRAGGRVLSLGMPATFPPEPLRGLAVCGFDAPVSTGTDARSASDPALYREIAAEVGPWMRPDLDESARDADFHERAVETLLSRVERKTRFALAALRRMRARGEAPDLMSVVFSESDTVGHHYWRDHDPASPRHDPNASEARRGAVAAVYEKLDAACGELRRAFGEDAACIVVSDHGMGGASRRVVHLNRFLRERGLLEREAGSGFSGWGGGADAWARAARSVALRALPPRARRHGLAPHGGLLRGGQHLPRRVDQPARPRGPRLRRPRRLRARPGRADRRPPRLEAPHERGRTGGGHGPAARGGLPRALRPARARRGRRAGPGCGLRSLPGVDALER
ncbi:MAG: alkaline phosphatase family protein [Proteobacteria bacterium]|nr:alkaline phosphatase family protein [Pseudomonadota bacterium]